MMNTWKDYTDYLYESDISLLTVREYYLICFCAL